MPGQRLGTGYRFTFFFMPVSKFLLLLSWAMVDPGEAGQNIERQGVAGKILREKELASNRVVNGWSRMLQACSFRNSQ
jgi:hypothetical protein